MAQVLKRFNFATLFCLVLGLASLAQAAASANVRVNGIGYPTAVSKRATVLTAAGANAFNVRRVSDNTSAFAGTLGAVVNNTDTTENVRFANFDALTEQGQFYLDVTGVGSSVNFTIADDVYNNATWVNLMGFYNQRCGMATSMTYNGDTWAHATCHMGDGNLSYYSGSNTTKNGTGGWHDAGDFGKYTVNAGITVGQMLQAWERFKSELSSLTTPVGSNAAIPDYLEEMKWEMDWVLKMQFPDGRVSHKLTRTNFEPYPLFPQADLATRYYVPWGSAATASFVAMCAIAARQFQPYDAAYATTLQNAATLSYNYLVANPADVQANQTGFGTGGYGTTDEDDRLWAAAEMWELTGNAAQLADLETRINAHGADKSDFNWDWGDVSNLGMYTYALSTRTGKTAITVADVRADIVGDANTMVTNSNGHGYGRALGMYYWGANGTVLRQCEHLDVANRITPNVNYLAAAQAQLSWALGRNYFNRSQITGLGINPAMNPHDRESSADAVVAPKPGHLVGGGHPNATSWVDDENDYAQNEIAINWDGATAYALAMWYQGPAAATPTPTSTRSPSFSPSPSITASPSHTATPTPLPCGPNVVQRRLRAQGTAFVDGAGNTWAAEQAYIVGGWGYISGTQAAPYAGAIAGTVDDGLYQSERYGVAPGYRFTVPNGFYQVRLKFSENYHNAVGDRIFDVIAEGQPVITNLDIYAQVGANAALDITFTANVFDGVLTLDFASDVDNAHVSAIEVTQLFGGSCGSPTSTVTPSRTVTRTATPSASASASPTRTATLSASATPSFSATRSASPSSSATGSATPSASQSPTVTMSPTITLSGTASETALGSFTFTPTMTVTPTITLTATVTASSSVTLSSSPSETALGSFTFTFTPTATPSSTFSASPTESYTPTETGTPSDTASPTASSSATATQTALGSATYTHSRTATPTFSATATNTPSHSPGTAATLAPSGDPKVLQAQPVPQPQAGPSFNFAVQIVGGVADTVELKLYTRAYTLLGTYKAKGSFGQGWNHPVRFDIPNLPNGVYFTRTAASLNGKVSKAGKSGRLVVLR